MQHWYLIILGLIGFSISLYIFSRKTDEKKLVCNLGEDCNKVIYSEYGKMFGIENTIFGMLYHTFIILSGLLMFFLPGLFSLQWVYLGEVIISGGALLFSVYLTWVQFAVLKEWCEYCIASAIVALLIFLVILL